MKQRANKKLTGHDFIDRFAMWSKQKANEKLSGSDFTS